MNLKSILRKKPIGIILDDAQQEEATGPHGLVRNLELKDLVAMGIAAIIGAGIFSTIGNASFHGGPGVSLLFIFTAIACGFSALCYAQFAAAIPISGSAYTYAYATFGELVAWIIGWDLIMEYAVGNIAVAISWSDYFTGMMSGFNIHIPEYFRMDYFSASKGYEAAAALLTQGTAWKDISSSMQEAYLAWMNAPVIGSLRLVADLPAMAIVVVVTYLVYIGIKESKRTNNIMVLLKIGVIFLVIFAGSYYVDPENWSPFAPNGISGILRGVSGVFFAYIGFDAISTTAEECKNPRRDLPKAMVYSLLICTVLYVIITLVLTGMVHYTKLQVGDPLAFVFKEVGLPWMSGIVAISAVIAMTTVLLVFQLGQPRIWMGMSRDGLLPHKFASIHSKYRTPGFATIVTGFAVALPVLFLNLNQVADLTSIGTLFAFVLVCAGVLHLKPAPDSKGFRVPYYNGKYILPLILGIIGGLLLYFNSEGIANFFSMKDANDPEISGWEVFKHKIPMIAFLVITLLMLVYTFLRNLSLIPVLGVIINLFLMTELGILNWMRFLGWLVIGLVIYFLYGIRKSKLRTDS
jgi:APA family basic amino acid/polyamine antiporter